MPVGLLSPIFKMNHCKIEMMQKYIGCIEFYTNPSEIFVCLITQLSYNYYYFYYYY